MSTSIEYLVGEGHHARKYSFNYQELKEHYLRIVNYTDDEFMANLPEIAHLSCFVSYLKGLSVGETLADDGIIHELIHLMHIGKTSEFDLKEIRELFKNTIKLA